jgi:S-adenosylmethionine synthetase
LDLPWERTDKADLLADEMKALNNDMENQEGNAGQGQ